MSKDDDWKRKLRSQIHESDRSWGVTATLSFLLGWAGADRFYLHQFVLGGLKLFTFGGLFIWWLIDFILLLVGQMADADGRKLAPPWKYQEYKSITLPRE
jgi:TM2 domain-containing membrane protein YozV